MMQIKGTHKNRSTKARLNAEIKCKVRTLWFIVTIEFSSAIYLPGKVRVLLMAVKFLSLDITLYPSHVL